MVVIIHDDDDDTDDSWGKQWPGRDNKAIDKAYNHDADKEKQAAAMKE